jgi:hypothetical protein
MPEIEEVKDLMARCKAANYCLDEQGTLWLKDHICVPQSKEIRDLILKEAHNSRYTIHLGCTKMYQDLKIRYWWEKMREDIVEYVATCDTCQRVKAEHQRPVVCYSRRRYWSGNGMISAWISQWVCLVNRKVMTPSG